VTYGFEIRTRHDDAALDVLKAVSRLATWTTPEAKMMRIVAGVTLALIWFGIAYMLPPLGFLIAFIHMVCFFLDAGMNGMRYASWAPINVIGAAMMLAGSFLGSPADADSMLGTAPIAPPPLGAPLVQGPGASLAPPTGERWTIQVLLAVDGRFKGGAQFGDTTYSSGEACATAVRNDDQLVASVNHALDAAILKYRPKTTMVITCAMELR
jgi:hypothetical protein